MSVMDDWDMKAVIQESYVLLTLFAELPYIVIIKMCAQTKTIKEKRSNWAKNIIIALFHLPKVLAIKHLVGEGQHFFPSHFSEGQENIHFGWGRATAFYFRVLKNPPVTPHHK